jgi:hypothetical protein
MKPSGLAVVAQHAAVVPAAGKHTAVRPGRQALHIAQAAQAGRHELSPVPAGVAIELENPVVRSDEQAFAGGISQAGREATQGQSRGADQAAPE